MQELCPGGTLTDILQQSMAPLSEERAAGLFRGIIKSVLHCHQVRAMQTSCHVGAGHGLWGGVSDRKGSCVCPLGAIDLLRHKHAAATPC